MPCAVRPATLEEAGFKTDTPVDVRVLPGCLILTAQEPRPETAEPEVLIQLRRACKKLSARKQRQIAEFIRVIATPQKRPLRNSSSPVAVCSHGTASTTGAGTAKE